MEKNKQKNIRLSWAKTKLFVSSEPPYNQIVWVEKRNSKPLKSLKKPVDITFLENGPLDIVSIEEEQTIKY